MFLQNALALARYSTVKISAKEDREFMLDGITPNKLVWMGVWAGEGHDKRKIIRWDTGMDAAHAGHNTLCMRG